MIQRAITPSHVQQWFFYGLSDDIDDIANNHGVCSVFNLLNDFTEDRRLCIGQIANSMHAGAPVTVDKASFAQVGLAENLADIFMLTLQHIHAEQPGTLDDR